MDSSLSKAAVASWADTVVLRFRSSETRLPDPNPTQPLLNCVTLSKSPPSLFLVVPSVT